MATATQSSITPRRTVTQSAHSSSYWIITETTRIRKTAKAHFMDDFGNLVPVDYALMAAFIRGGFGVPNV